MFGDYYYHKTTRKIVSIFGTLFNNIVIKKFDNNHNEIERMVVPISYGPKEKYYIREKQDPDLDKPLEQTLPRITFNLQQIQYDANRKLRPVGKNYKDTSNQTFNVQYNPVPYNLTFSLDVLTKYTDEGLQIIEQILPYFTPKFTVQYLPIPEMELKEDLHITLNSVDTVDNWSDDWTTKRIIEWNFIFEVKANYYPTINEQGVIKTAITNIHSKVPTDEFGDVIEPDLAEIPRVARITTKPDPLNAQPTDEFGFTETYEEFNDGKRFNPDTGTDEDII